MIKGHVDTWRSFVPIINRGVEAGFRRKGMINYSSQSTCRYVSYASLRCYLSTLFRNLSFVVRREKGEEEEEEKGRKEGKKEGKSALNKWNFLLASLKKYKSNNTVTKINIYIYICARLARVSLLFIYIFLMIKNSLLPSFDRRKESKEAAIIIKSRESDLKRGLFTAR